MSYEVSVGQQYLCDKTYKVSAKVVNSKRSLHELRDN